MASEKLDATADIGKLCEPFDYQVLATAVRWHTLVHRATKYSGIPWSACSGKQVRTANENQAKTLSPVNRAVSIAAQIVAGWHLLKKTLSGL